MVIIALLKTNNLRRVGRYYLHGAINRIGGAHVFHFFSYADTNQSRTHTMALFVSMQNILHKKNSPGK